MTGLVTSHEVFPQSLIALVDSLNPPLSLGLCPASASGPRRSRSLARWTNHRSWRAEVEMGKGPPPQCHSLAWLRPKHGRHRISSS